MNQALHDKIIKQVSRLYFELTLLEKADGTYTVRMEGSQVSWELAPVADLSFAMLTFDDVLPQLEGH